MGAGRIKLFGLSGLPTVDKPGRAVTTLSRICFLKCTKGGNPMSYTSVMVTEGQLSWAEGMKRFRKNAEPGLKAAKKAGILNSSEVVPGNRTVS